MKLYLSEYNHDSIKALFNVWLNGNTNSASFTFTLSVMSCFNVSLNKCELTT